MSMNEYYINTILFILLLPFIEFVSITDLIKTKSIFNQYMQIKLLLFVVCKIRSHRYRIITSPEKYITKVDIKIKDDV